MTKTNSRLACLPRACRFLGCHWLLNFKLEIMLRLFWKRQIFPKSFKIVFKK